MSLDFQSFIKGGLLHDRYHWVEGINEGSFGIVTLAKDTKNNNRLVALKYNTYSADDFRSFEKKESIPACANGKIEHPELSKSYAVRETKQEVGMLRKVGKHPNIAQLLDTFDTYIVMEYISRGDLHDAIQYGIAPVSTRDVVDVFMQLVAAVEHCHKLGVYHRDIKPENILIAQDWSIKLTDFGLATDHLHCKDFDVGSERYMAPELLEHEDIDDYRADKVDIWSLGICLLNIVFGKCPFKSASSKDKLFLYFASNRETLFDIFPSMSYDLFGVLRHSLTIDPENRDLELMKQSLQKVEILTYDYEFEEEAEAEREEKEKAKQNQDKLPEREPFAPMVIEPTAEVKTAEKADSLGKFIGKSVPERSALTMSIQKLQESGRKMSPVKEVAQEDSSKSVNRKEVATEKPYNFRKRLRNFPNQRKPITIPTGIRHNDRSQKGRIFNQVPSEDRSPFSREDFFTPRSVFNHYIEKTNQHRKFDHRTREYSNYYYDHRKNLSNHENRAWRKRPTGHTYLDHYREGNRIRRRGRKYTNNHERFYGRKQDSMHASSVSSRAVPVTSYRLRPASQPVQNFSSPTGKYIPPNMRLHAASPVLHPQKMDIPKLASTNDISGEEDGMFMFEDVPKLAAKEVDESRTMDKLSAQFSNDCKVEDRRSARTKYIPPHHRRLSSNNRLSREPMAISSVLGSSNSSTDRGENPFLSGSSPGYRFKDKRDEQYISDGLGLSYIDASHDDETQRRQLGLYRPPSTR